LFLYAGREWDRHFVNMGLFGVVGGAAAAAGENARVADAQYLRLKAAHPVAGPAVASDFFVDITNNAHLYLLGQELRRAPIQVQVDAILILRRLIYEIVGKAHNRREFVPGLRIEIRIAPAGINCPVPDANIRKPVEL
jgi:hypothetical protein